MTDRTSIAEYHDRIAALAPALRERAGEAGQQMPLVERNLVCAYSSGLDPIIASTFSHIPRGRQNGILSL